METYTSQILNLVTQSFSPEEVCRGLKMCSAKLEAAINVSQMQIDKVKDTDSAPFQKCDVCVDALTLVERFMRNSTFAHDLQKVMDEACKTLHLPPYWRDYCLKTVKSDMHLAELALLNMDPETVVNLQNQPFTMSMVVFFL